MDLRTLHSIFDNQTVFSIFFKNDCVYDLIHGQLDEFFKEANKDDVSATEQQHYAGRLLAVL